MPINPDDLMSRQSRGDRRSWHDRDSMLYALSVGMGRDPLDQAELPFVYEGSGLRTLPTMASLLVNLGLLDDCGWQAEQVVHSEESLTLNRPLADAGAVILDSKVLKVTDKGPEHGAVIVVESRARSVADEQPVFTVRRTLVARGDGGFGGASHNRSSGHEMPAGEADLSCTARTRPDQALWFRLLGDRGVLHADPGRARRSGFARPILHGLCTAGVACRAVLRTICEYDPTLIRSFDLRFTAPVYPGETLRTDMWQQANIVSFRMRAEDRNVTVVDDGRCVLAT